MYVVPFFARHSTPTWTIDHRCHYMLYASGKQSIFPSNNASMGLGGPTLSDRSEVPVAGPVSSCVPGWISPLPAQGNQYPLESTPQLILGLFCSLFFLYACPGTYLPANVLGVRSGPTGHHMLTHLVFFTLLLLIPAHIGIQALVDYHYVGSIRTTHPLSVYH